MKVAARLLVLAYGALLCIVGIVGVFTAPWELRTVFALDLAALPETARATLLNQYRFLKAVEFGAGIFCLALHRPILAGGAERRMFLALVAAGVMARILAWINDGRPGSAFVVFLALETLVLVVVATRRVRADA